MPDESEAAKLYILETYFRSTTPKSLSYIGVTSADLDERLVLHNKSMKGTSESHVPGHWYTSYHGPFKLVFYVDGMTENVTNAAKLTLQTMAKTPAWKGTKGRMAAFLHMIQ